MPGPRLLACFAHPDDEAFPVGGALAAHAARGVTVGLVTATLGEEGEIRQQGLASRESLGEVRRGELARSAKTLGIAEPVVLDYRDSGMAGTPSNQHPGAYINVPDEAVVERLVEQIRIFRPQVVLTFEPGRIVRSPGPHRRFPPSHGGLSTGRRCVSISASIGGKPGSPLAGAPLLRRPARWFQDAMGSSAAGGRPGGGTANAGAGGGGHPGRGNSPGNGREPPARTTR